MRTTIPREFAGVSESRTLSAQQFVESDGRELKSPLTVKYRYAKGKVYKKTKEHRSLRIAYRAGGRCAVSPDRKKKERRETGDIEIYSAKQFSELLAHATGPLPRTRPGTCGHGKGRETRQCLAINAMSIRQTGRPGKEKVQG